MFDRWTIGCLAIPVLFATAYVLAGWLPNRLPANGQHPGRVGFVDGLRGFLALAVIAHHYALKLMLLETGTEDLPPNAILRNSGPAAVMLFFMITGFLFYRKAIARNGQLGVIRFFIGRYARLAPAFYITLLLVMLSAVTLHANEVHDVSISDASSFANWLLFSVPLGASDILGINPHSALSVVWTLRYEWLFYASYPVLCLVISWSSPSPGVRTVALIGSLLAGLVFQNVVSHGFSLGIMSSFGWGMLAAEILEIPAARQIVGTRSFGIVGCLALGAELLAPSRPYDAMRFGLAAMFFIAIVAGNNVLRFLGKRNCIVLGDASYGIYLLHLLSLDVAMTAVRGLSLLADPFLQWLPMLVAGLCVTTCAAVMYHYVEYPAIVLGRGRPRRPRQVQEIEQSAP